MVVPFSPFTVWGIERTPTASFHFAHDDSFVAPVAASRVPIQKCHVLTVLSEIDVIQRLRWRCVWTEAQPLSAVGREPWTAAFSSLYWGLKTDWAQWPILEKWDNSTSPLC